ncbi:hypothetical protein MSPP1_003475 [Malassezia sp. CBS 17886]|nr:hypothetical protein MSPP1_003475 [Malassezia sp. CBS 17886]
MMRGGSVDEDPAEAQQLILHQIEADEHGRPVLHSVPTGSAPEEASAGPSLEERDGAKMPSTDDLEKTGRPEWLDTFSVLPRRRRRMLLIGAAAAVAVLLGAVFYFALGPRVGLPMPKHTYESGGDVWKDEDTLRNAFPTDIGHPGTYQSGVPPEFAQEMRPAPSPTRGVEPIQTAVAGFSSQFNPFEHMGPLSPYYSASFGGIDNARYLAAPRAANGSCTLSQVHILHRHGARYPTGGSPTELVKPLLIARDEGRTKFSGDLAFMNTYTYRVGAELLVPLGREQLHLSGVKAAIDYGRLVDTDLRANRRLFVRTGSQQRIVDSALAWTAGFWGNPWVNKTDVEIQIEDPGFNTTLAPNFACRSATESTRASSWIDEYLADTTARLNQFVVGAKLTPRLVYGMQQLCPYDTVAFGSSEFCALFTEADWRGFEYAWDLKFFGDYGPGSSVGPAMGLGWLNEFLSRLTRTPWNKATQTSENSTLNEEPQLFPVDRALYADFTHDSVLTSVIAAMRLAEFEKKPDRGDVGRAFRSSHVVPFSARMVFERFDCDGPLADEHVLARASPSAPRSYMRMKLNDAIVPLAQLSQCESRADGLCSLDAFLASHADRNDQGWWARCAV